jgi:hypothetical protein
MKRRSVLKVITGVGISWEHGWGWLILVRLMGA